MDRELKKAFAAADKDDEVVVVDAQADEVKTAGKGSNEAKAAISQVSERIAVHARLTKEKEDAEAELDRALVDKRNAKPLDLKLQTAYNFVGKCADRVEDIATK